MAVMDALHSLQVYNNLLANPVAVLTGADLVVNTLPNANDGTTRNLWFAAHGISIVIDAVATTAAMFAGGPADCAIGRNMLVSPMRAYGLPVGAGAGGRHHPTVLLGVGAASPQLWVTEMQTGCSVLVLGWGGGQYSMTHLQPSDDTQFNAIGQLILSTCTLFHNLYKNAWLKKELTTIVENTAIVAPQRYILIQSMFEASVGHSTQVIGVRNGTNFDFYRQRHLPPANRTVEQLAWSTWSSLLPYLSY